MSAKRIQLSREVVEAWRVDSSMSGMELDDLRVALCGELLEAWDERDNLRTTVSEDLEYQRRLESERDAWGVALLHDSEMQSALRARMGK